MVLDPREFYDLASQLHSDRHYRTEAGLRTAISRAYYACFLASRKKMQELGISFPDIDGIHRDLIDKVKEKDTKMGNHLETLRAKRVDADYMLKALVNGVECGNLLKLAEVVLGEVHQLK